MFDNKGKALSSWITIFRAAVFSAIATSYAVGTSVGLAEDEPTPRKVVKLLRIKCAKCHGPLDPKGQLNLSSLRGMARGGESGIVVSPSDPDDSLLWQRVFDDEMPPNTPLSAEEKSLLRNWIEGDAPGIPVGDLGPVVGADHWAYQHFSASSVPSLKNNARVRTEIDHYVQAGLESAGLSLGPEANRPTLIRRVSLDLTGLLPTPDDVDAFLADNRPDAYERMVDRYLASPQFGERWGKQWLDAAGYADSNGYFSADTDRPLAYRYRDYVIRSVNSNKSYDRFLHEQIAGDEIAGFRPGEPTKIDTIDLLIATHFLRNGQDGTDIGVKEPEAFEIDRRAALEAAIQVTASSLLGLTVQCARCHDHKFEPITQREYYQLQAILFPAFNPQDWVNPVDRVVHAYLPGEKETWATNEKQLMAELDQLKTEFTEWLNANREPSDVLLHEKFADESWKTRWSNTAPGDDHPGGRVTIDGADGSVARVRDGSLQVVAGPDEAWLSTTASFDWTPETQDAWIQATFDLIDNKVASPPAMRIGYTIAAHDFDDSSDRVGGNLLIDGNPSTTTSLYHDYPGTDQMVVGAIGKQGYQPGHNYGVRVTNIGDGEFRLEHVVNGLPEEPSIERSAADLPDGGFALFYCCSRSYVVDEVRVEKSLETAARPDIVAKRAELVSRRETYSQRRRELEAKRTPEPGRAIAWVTDKSPTAVEVPFLTRGEYHLRGPNVQPGALEILTDTDHEYRPANLGEAAQTTGRRLGFAKWLTRDEGRPAALTARVYSNRIWQQYFGRGIVATTDNLGIGGAPPSHPQLLDRLAAGFVASGWNPKQLHRRIITSTVYRQSSAPHSDGLAADPDNILLWRRSLRRMQAELIRDNLLVAAGRLNQTPFGPYVPTQQTPVGEVVVDPKTPGAQRRSIYLQQRRSQTLSLLKVFDAPSVATICTERPSSTVPLQSLSLMNSDFSLACSEGFADRLRAETDGTRVAMVRYAWRVATSRMPTDVEQAIAVKFITEQEQLYKGQDHSIRAVADLCQMLLASNSFLYVE